MSSPQAKMIFALSCIICMLAIAIGAVLEVSRQRRGESLLRPGQFRLRMLSALVWMIALGSLAYAVAFLWPEKPINGAKLNAREVQKFLSLISGSFMLILIALILLCYDILQVARERRRRENQFQNQLDAMARDEISKMHEKTEATGTGAVEPHRE